MEYIHNAKPADGLPSESGQNEDNKTADNSIIDAPKRQPGFIESLLLPGAENAQTTAELLNITGLKSSRALQRIIAKERAAGAVILSKLDNGGGYFRASPGEQGRREITAYIRTLSNRARRTFRATKSAKRAITSNDSQFCLW